MKKIKKIVDNDAWVATHFEKIVDKFGGRYPYIFVSRGKVFPIKTGDDVVKIEQRITRKYGKPLGMPVPTKEELLHHILVCSLL